MGAARSTALWRQLACFSKLGGSSRFHACLAVSEQAYLLALNSSGMFDVCSLVLKALVPEFVSIVQPPAYCLASARLALAFLMTRHLPPQSLFHLSTLSKALVLVLLSLFACLWSSAIGRSLVCCLAQTVVFQGVACCSSRPAPGLEGSPRQGSEGL